MQGRGLLVIFTLTLLLPGVALALFGARALIQERQLVDQQIRERLEATADTVARDVEARIRDWQLLLDQGSTSTAIPGALDSAGVLVLLAGDKWTATPPEALLYDLPSASFDGVGADRVKSKALIEGETLELELHDYPAAIAGYRQALASAPSDARAELLHHLGRTYRKAGREHEALESFEVLKTTAGYVGRVPAGLIGHYEVCSGRASSADREGLARCGVDFYRLLVAGQWRLSKQRYSHYSTAAREWAATATDAAAVAAVTDAVAKETVKAALTSEVELLSARICGRELPLPSLQVAVSASVLAISRCATGSSALTGRILAFNHAWLRNKVWPLLTGMPGQEPYHVALIDRDNHPFYSSQPTGISTRTPAITRDLAGVAEGWRVRVWLQNSQTLAAGLRMRERMYVLTLAVVIATLMFGGYVTHRVVKRELRVAQLKSEFVSTVSHEFRSPLTAIRQLGEMLMHNRVPEPRRGEYYQRITTESERLGRLVENLLDFAQMEEGRKRYHLQPLDTTDWLRRTVSDFQSVREGGALVTATIPTSLPVLQGDPAALSCAIHNLLDNAIKYSPGTDTIWLEAEEDGGGVTIHVRDRGVGITASDRQQIFEKFFRASGEITRQVKGAGLGLSLVHHIVAAHNGQIECESQPGLGTTFSIHLPVTPVRA